MISKKVAMKTLEKNRFGKLVAYLLDPQGKKTRRSYGPSNVVERLDRILPAEQSRSLAIRHRWPAWAPPIAPGVIYDLIAKILTFESAVQSTNRVVNAPADHLSRCPTKQINCWRYRRLMSSRRDPAGT
jgi:hypothetical protein